MDVETLQQRIGHRFRLPDLPVQALTHRSFGQPNNERLEFLGDSVLNCAIAAVLFERFPAEDEGDLSRLRAYLVKQQALYRIAQRLSLGEFLRLGDGESRSGGFRRPSILADALEAVIGAVYLDAGFDATRELIARLYQPELLDANPRTLGKDAKTLLQEALQHRRLPLPVYTVIATHGAAHNQTFEVECQISRLAVSVIGAGGSRRAAEQVAAELALAAVAAVAADAALVGKKTRVATDSKPVPVSRRANGKRAPGVVGEPRAENAGSIAPAPRARPARKPDATGERQP